MTSKGWDLSAAAAGMGLLVGGLLASVGRARLAAAHPEGLALAQRHDRTSLSRTFVRNSASGWRPPAPTKHSGCVVRNGLPDPACTPGDVIPENTAEVVCDAKHFRTGALRSSGAELEATKRRLYRAYGMRRPHYNPVGPDQVCELDHVVSLELGGADTDANLFPECREGYDSWSGPSFLDKDNLERHLWYRVCVDRSLSLEDAQRAIATNWVQAWKEAGRSVCDSRYRCK